MASVESPGNGVIGSCALTQPACWESNSYPQQQQSTFLTTQPLLSFHQVVVSSGHGEGGWRMEQDSEDLPLKLSHWSTPSSTSARSNLESERSRERQQLAFHPHPHHLRVPQGCTCGLASLHSAYALGEPQLWGENFISG